MIRLLKLLIRDNEAASAVEYAVLIALIAAVIVFSVQRLGNTLNTSFATVDSAISASVGSGGDLPDDDEPHESCCD